MHGDSKTLTTEEEWEAAVKWAIKLLTWKWSHAHYRLDVESVVWYAAGILWTHPKEEQTPALLFYIADKILFREVNVKLRNIYVTDMSKVNPVEETSPYEECKQLSVETLTEDERQYLEWILDDGLRLSDIAELRGVARSTVTKKWQRIISKLRDENL